MRSLTKQEDQIVPFPFITAYQRPTMLSPKPNFLLLLSLVFQTAQGMLDYSTGFPCNDNSISLNPGPRAFPQLVENDDDDQCTLRMSPDQVGRSVSAFTSYTFGNGNNQYAFDTTFTYQLSGIMNGIGDGIAFVLHQDSRGTGALANGGGDLGVYGSGIIRPAIVVELDTCAYIYIIMEPYHN